MTTILFDLDGTLLPMDQDQFVKAYLSCLAKAMAPHGYDPQLLVKAIGSGFVAMLQNDGSARNETVFWNAAQKYFSRDLRQDEALFESFYENEFQQVQKACGKNPMAAETIAAIHTMGYRTILATSPLFPPAATYSRVRWAGLRTQDFELITTYDNSSYCKPNSNYYREILKKQHLKPEECLMVGNDAEEDMIAQSLGMRVFLLTDCLINRDGRDISGYPQGSFPDLLAFIQNLKEKEKEISGLPDHIL